MIPNKSEVLLVEDSPADIRLAKEAFADVCPMTKLNVVRDGVQAMAFLRHQGVYSGMRLPALILLDLNLPRKDGREVISEVKADADLRRIPIIVLSTSRSEIDVMRCYDLHANCYIVKSHDIDHTYAIVRSIEEFWMKVATLAPP